MGRGKWWTQEENRLLREMLDNGMTAEQIYQSGKFPNRSFHAIERAIQRLGSFGNQSKKFFGHQIREAETS